MADKITLLIQRIPAGSSFRLLADTLYNLYVFKELCVSDCMLTFDCFEQDRGTRDIQFYVIFKKLVHASCFIGVSNTRKLMKARGRRPSAFIVFECLKPG